MCEELNAVWIGFLSKCPGRACSEWKSDEVTAVIKSLHGFS